MNKKPPEGFPVFGISPLGGNVQEGTSEGFTSAQKSVPLEYDNRVGCFISRQAQEELDDKEHARKLAEVFNGEETFRRKAGFR